MTKALALAGKNGKTSGGMAREFQEGVRRMYGAKRLEAAKSKYAPSTAGKGRGSAGMAGATKPVTKPAPKPTAKNNTKSNLLKGVGGAVAVGALVASKGKATGLASKLAPGLTKGISKSAVGKAVFGTGEKLTNKAFATSGKIAAKTKGTVSQSQYEAMQAAAKAKGIKPLVKAPAKSADAARASYPSVAGKSGLRTKTFGEVSKNVAKATATKKKPKLGKAGIAATGAGQTNKK